MKIRQVSSAVLLALSMGLVSAQALAGGVHDKTPGDNSMSCGGSGGRNPAGCGGHGVMKYGFTYASDLRLWDEPTSYVPAYGPWVSLGLSLTSGDVKRASGTQAGGWNIGISSYVTTVVTTATTLYSSAPTPVANAAQVYTPSGFETYISATACSATATMRCDYPKDAISQVELKRTGGDVSSYPAAVRAALSDPRAFVRALPGGLYEVYGGTPESIRMVSGGYEAWLSARIDRSGLTLRFHYEMGPGGLQRVRSLTDATGLETRLYYADNEPRFESTRSTITELVSVHPSIGLLVTSIADPYGHHVEFTYQDAWTGLILGEALSTKLDPALHAGIRDQSGLFRLITSQDVLGVQSRIRYACGAVSLPESLLLLQSGQRGDGRTAIAPNCVAFGSSGPVAGSLWLDPYETETPYGINRYRHIDQEIGTQHRKGWIAQNALGQIEWKETVFGSQGEELRRQMSTLLGRGLGDRPAHIPGSAWGRLISSPSIEFRTSYQWSFRALRDYPFDASVDLFARTTPLPAMPSIALAHIEQYAHDYPAGSGGTPMMSSVKVWEKFPGIEEGVFYAYQNAASGDTFRNSSLTGATSALPNPSVVARRLEDGSMQATYTRYNAQGNPTITVDAMGRAQEIEYAANGLDVINAYAVRWSGAGEGSATRLERLAHLEVNDRGQVIREEGTLAGVGTTLDYETSAPYRLTGVTNELGLRTRYDWTTIGTDPLTRTDRLTVTAPNGVTSTADYQRGVLIQQTGEGRTRTYAGHDAFGRPATVSVGGEVKVRYTYNPSNPLDLQTIHNETNGSEVTISTDPLGRPEWTWQTHAMGEVLSVGYRRYDLSGNLASLWTSNGTYSEVVGWQYDILGRPIARSDMDGTQMALVYSPTTGRLQASKDANDQWSFYQYDANGALLSKRLSDPTTGRETVRMEYDAIYGRVNRTFDAIGMTEYHYSANQPYQLEWVDDPLPGSGHTRITPSYDSINRSTGWGLTNEDSSAVTSRVAMRFDDTPVGMGRVSQYENELFTATPSYDPVDAMRYGELNRISYEVPEAHAMYPGMVQSIGRTDTAHDRAINSLSFQMPLTGEQMQSGVTFDTAGRVTNVTGLIGDASRSYQYDARSQLTHASRWQGGVHQQTKGYSYDEIGNRTQVATEDEMLNPINIDRTATYGLSNRLGTLQVGTITQTAEHDLAGNLTFNPSNGQRYTWDQENRLIRIDYPVKDAGKDEKSKNYTRFTYDSSQRIRSIEEFEDGNRIEYSIYNWVGAQVVQKLDGATLRIEQTYNADGYADHHIDGSVTKYFLTRDYLGSVNGKVSANGQVLERIDYDAWGEPENRQVRDDSGNLVPAARNASEIPFGYAGYWKHNRSKLSITAHRFYDPKLGRWLSKDLIAELGGINLYGYVGNNPTNFIDPSGLVPRDPVRCMQLITQFNTMYSEDTLLDDEQTGAANSFLSTLPSLHPATRSRMQMNVIGNHIGDVRVNMDSRYLPQFDRWLGTSNGATYLRAINKRLDLSHRMGAVTNEMRYACGDDDDNGPVSSGDGNNVAEWAEGRSNAAGRLADFDRNWVPMPDGTERYIGSGSPYVAGAAVFFIASGLLWGSGAGESGAAGAGIMTAATAAWIGLIGFGSELEAQAQSLFW